MKRAFFAIPLILLAGIANAQQAGDCATLSQPRPMPVRPTVVAPVAAELAAPSQQLGAPTGVLASAYDEAQSVDQVVFRLKLQNCGSVAQAAPETAPAAAETTDPAAYKPKTEFDNTPWRFNMNQNGKRMTAEEFDAWMKSRGVRVAKGAAPAAAAAPAAVQEAPAAVEGDGKGD